MSRPPIDPKKALAVADGRGDEGRPGSHMQLVELAAGGGGATPAHLAWELQRRDWLRELLLFSPLGLAPFTGPGESILGLALMAYFYLGWPLLLMRLIWQPVRDPRARGGAWAQIKDLAGTAEAMVAAGAVSGLWMSGIVLGLVPLMVRSPRPGHATLAFPFGLFFVGLAGAAYLFIRWTTRALAAAEVARLPVAEVPTRRELAAAAPSLGLAARAASLFETAFRGALFFAAAAGCLWLIPESSGTMVTALPRALGLTSAAVLGMLGVQHVARGAFYTAMSGATWTALDARRRRLEAAARRGVALAESDSPADREWATLRRPAEVARMAGAALAAGAAAYLATFALDPTGISAAGWISAGLGLATLGGLGAAGAARRAGAAAPALVAGAPADRAGLPCSPAAVTASRPSPARGALAAAAVYGLASAGAWGFVAAAKAFGGRPMALLFGAGAVLLGPILIERATWLWARAAAPAGAAAPHAEDRPGAEAVLQRMVLAATPLVLAFYAVVLLGQKLPRGGVDVALRVALPLIPLIAIQVGMRLHLAARVGSDPQAAPLAAPGSGALAVQHAGEGRGLPDVLQAADPGDEPLDADAEAAVGDAAVAP